MKPLVIIPTYLRTPADLAMTLGAVRSCRETQRQGVEILLVDDGSPEQSLVDDLETKTSELSFEVHRKPENTGYSKTINVGLQRALLSGQDAVTINADILMTTPNWVRTCKATTDEKGDKAAVIGGLLSYPTGQIQHAGVYFSMLTRDFNHLYKYAPETLPEAHTKRICPVTGAFQYIRHETLEKVGIYDPAFHMGWEDVDYCIRVFLARMRCVYNPNVRAIHDESMFRGRPSPKIDEWQRKSFIYLMLKYRNLDFSDFYANPIGERHGL